MLKTLLKYIAGTMLVLTVGNQASQAQDVIRQQSCDISGYTAAIDSIKQYYEERGFSLLRQAEHVYGK